MPSLPYRKQLSRCDARPSCYGNRRRKPERPPPSPLGTFSLACSQPKRNGSRHGAETRGGAGSDLCATDGTEHRGASLTFALTFGSVW